MGHTSSKITAPVSLHGDVYPVLGINKSGDYYDTGWVCGNSHGKINKWSKRKPIRYAQPGELTDAQFKGTYADNNQGIYYGLKVASEAGRLGQLHTASWEYLPPRPGTDWCRLTDFVGYDHNAVPTLNGMYTGGNPCYYNTERNFTVSITYNKSSNTTGVDIGDMLPENVAEDIGDYYPCILIGGYARVLYNTQLQEESTGTDLIYTPLRQNNQWYTRFYAHVASLPGVKDGTTYQCTVFLIRSVYQAGIFDFRTAWANVADTINAYNAFSVPGAISLQIPFEFYQQYTVLEVYAANYYGTWPDVNSGFQVLVHWPNGTPDETPATYRISVSSPGTGGSKDYVYNPPQVNLAPIFKWTDIGLLPNPAGSKPTSVSGSVLYIDSSGVGHPVSSFNVTLS